MNVFHHETMATSFEVRIHAEDDRYAAQTPRAAFGLLNRIEGWRGFGTHHSLITGICLIAVGAAAGFLTSGCSEEAGRSIEFLDTSDAMGSILRSNWFALNRLVPASYTFPASLLELNRTHFNRRLLQCPNNDSPPGPIESVEDWTDFVYVGNLTDYTIWAAMLISPPENHGGRHGYVLFRGGMMARMRPAEVRHLIADPLTLETNASEKILEEARLKMTIHIPNRLKQYYRAEGSVRETNN